MRKKILTVTIMFMVVSLPLTQMSFNADEYTKEYQARSTRGHKSNTPMGWSSSTNSKDSGSYHVRDAYNKDTSADLYDDQVVNVTSHIESDTDLQTGRTAHAHVRFSKGKDLYYTYEDY
ncbi:MAG: hypothetical protein ACK5HR_01830 [Mycoplasmatales bacterium]